jgi:hypothetical protein
MVRLAGRVEEGWGTVAAPKPEGEKQGQSMDG